MLNLLFITDPYEKLDLVNDASILIMAEAHRRGHRVWITTADNLRVDHDIPKGILTLLTSVSGERKIWKEGKTEDRGLDSMDLIFMRKDPPFTVDYIIATYILSLAVSRGVRVMNDPMALRNFNEKMGILQFSRFIPPTLVTKKYADLSAFLKRHGPIVLNPLERSSGQEVIVLHQKDKNRNSLFEILTKGETRYIMAQKYLSAVKQGDKRIFILNGEIAGAYVRFSHPSDHRTNLHSGGTSAPTKLSAREKAACKGVGSSLKKLGIFFAGIDMIGGFITEINVTSPGGGFDVVNKEAKIKLEEKIVDFMESYA